MIENNYQELINVCQQTKTKYTLDKGFLFDFIIIGKLEFAFSPNGKYMYCFKFGQKSET